MSQELFFFKVNERTVMLCGKCRNLYLNSLFSYKIYFISKYQEYLKPQLKRWPNSKWNSNVMLVPITIWTSSDLEPPKGYFVCMFWGSIKFNYSNFLQNLIFIRIAIFLKFYAKICSIYSPYDLHAVFIWECNRDPKMYSGFGPIIVTCIFNG